MAVARSMQQREFVLECDKELPANEQTTFLIVPLSSKAQVEISDLLSKSEGMFTEIVIEKDGEKRTHRSPIPANYHERVHATLGKCLIGWVNYKDAEGNQLDFNALSPDERVNRLYPDWREELFAFIESLNYPSEAALKN